MREYKKSKEQWNKIFDNINGYSPEEELSIPEIEQALDWLIEGNISAIHFGCGNGKILGRCLSKGLKFVHGIDYCEECVGEAGKFMKDFGFGKRTDLLTGGIDHLNLFMQNSVDSAILFNRRENLTPSESIEIAIKINKIVKKEGKILLIVNPYLEKEKILEAGFKEVSEDFYVDEDGFQFWNLSNEKLIEMMEPYFSIEKRIDVIVTGSRSFNRVFYLKNK